MNEHLHGCTHTYIFIVYCYYTIVQEIMTWTNSNIVTSTPIGLVMLTLKSLFIKDIITSIKQRVPKNLTVLEKLDTSYLNKP